MNVLPITTNKLLIVAGLFWVIAGVSILQIGVKAYIVEPFALWIPLATAVIFSMFYFMIFRKMVIRNEHRIISFNETKTGLLRFLDKKGYIIMIFMMTLGVSLRLSGIIPGWFFAFFYTGLGAALLLAGINSITKYTKQSKLAANEK